MDDVPLADLGYAYLFIRNCRKLSKNIVLTTQDVDCAQTLLLKSAGYSG